MSCSGSCDSGLKLGALQTRLALLERQLKMAQSTAAPDFRSFPDDGRLWRAKHTWQGPNSCNSYLGFEIEPPTFQTKKKEACEGGGCDVESPSGGWTTFLRISGLVAGATAVIKILTTADAAIPAMSVMDVFDATANVLPPSLVTMGAWTTVRTRQLFPGFGQDSSALVAGTSITNIATQQTEALMLPVTYYTEQVLDDCQNNLPGIMQRVNAGSTQTGFGYSVFNGKAVTIDLVFKLYIAYAEPDEEAE